MIRGHLIRLYPNEQQKVMLAKTAGVTRYCYNWGLAKWDELRKNGEKCDPYTLSRLWTKEKPEWAKEVNAGSQTKALLNLGVAFSFFFRKLAKYPTFHKKGQHRDSFYVSNDKAWFKKDGKLHLPGIGNVRLAEKLRFDGKILRYVVSRHADQWFVGITVELADTSVKNDDNTAVGIDVGTLHWGTASDGLVLNRPKKLAKLEKRLKHAKRVRCRRVKGSKNRFKAQMREAKIYKKMYDIKLDAMHKFTSKVAKSHGIVCCETLHVRGMGKSGIKQLRVAVQRGGMTELRRQLSYKAAHYVEVDRFYPSSKTCSNCGHKHSELKLWDRTFICPHCGFKLDRDLNAAINIRDEGMRIFTEGHSGSACGGCGSN